MGWHVFFQFFLEFKNEMIWFNKAKTGIIMVFFWHKKYGFTRNPCHHGHG